MREKYSTELCETLKITEYADKEAKSILSELDLQSEKLMEIQKISGESRGLLFFNGQLVESAGKGVGAKRLILVLFVLSVLLLLIFIKIQFY